MADSSADIASLKRERRNVAAMASKVFQRYADGAGEAIPTIQWAKNFLKLFLTPTEASKKIGDVNRATMSRTISGESKHPLTYRTLEDLLENTAPKSYTDRDCETKELEQSDFETKDCPIPFGEYRRVTKIFNLSFDEPTALWITRCEVDNADEVTVKTSRELKLGDLVIRGL